MCSSQELRRNVWNLPVSLFFIFLPIIKSTCVWLFLQNFASLSREWSGIGWCAILIPHMSFSFPLCFLVILYSPPLLWYLIFICCPPTIIVCWFFFSWSSWLIIAKLLSVNLHRRGSNSPVFMLENIDGLTLLAICKLVTIIVYHIFYFFLFTSPIIIDLEPFSVYFPRSLAFLVVLFAHVYPHLPFAKNCRSILVIVARPFDCCNS